jgi:hypothetical protein
LCCHARGTSFLFPESEVLLNEFFEPNKAILPHNIPYSSSELVESLTVKNVTNITLVSTFEVKIVCVLGSFGNAMPCFVFLFRNHSGVIIQYIRVKQGTIVH